MCFCVEIPLGKNQKTMITVLKDVADYMFSSALDKITILTDQPEVQFKLLYGDTEILNETYVPDAEGKNNNFRLTGFN